MDIRTRKAIPFEEVDTATLRQALSQFESPDDKIRSMVRRGELLRVRRGLYAVAPEYRHTLFSPEVLANLIYGPSYLSLEYALSWYGMIPERVSELTSVCLGRSRSFETGVGNFPYCSTKKVAYVEGYDLIPLQDKRSFLMAVREKALVDLIENRRNVPIRSRKDMKIRLLEDLRMEETMLSELNMERIEYFASLYGSARTRLFLDFLMELHEKRR